MYQPLCSPQHLPVDHSCRVCHTIEMESQSSASVFNERSAFPIETIATGLSEFHDHHKDNCHEHFTCVKNIFGDRWAQVKCPFSIIFSRPEHLLSIGLDTQLRGDKREVRFHKNWQPVDSSMMEVWKRRVKCKIPIREQVGAPIDNMNTMPNIGKITTHSADVATQCNIAADAVAKDRKVLIQNIRRLKRRLPAARNKR